MKPTSYYVSRHNDGRDAIEIVTASGYEAAAEKAHHTYGMQPINGQLHVIRNGDLRVVEVDRSEETLKEPTGEELL